MILGVLLLLATTLALFRPWVPRPFDIRDFSEFLPYLTGNTGLWSRFTAFVGYYVGEHARLNVVSYAGLVLKWTLLGASPVAWQWARVAEMGLLVAGVYALGRRLALRPAPALAAASLFVVSRISSEAWTRMTMGEPLGLLLALGALILATTWRERPAETWRIVGAGVLMALAVLAKEMLIALLPLLWLIGIARGEDGRLGTPALNAANRRLVALSGLAPLIAFGAVVLVAMTRGHGGISDLYGGRPAGIGTLLGLITRPWLLVGERGGFTGFALPGNALFLLLLVTGGWAEARHPERRAHLGWMVTIAVTLSLFFAVLYLPWPYTYHYYAIPFLLGPALLLGLAVQALAEEGPAAGRVVAGAVILLGLLVAPTTAQATSSTIAFQQVNGEITRSFGVATRATRIVVARSSLAPMPWMGTGPTLRRYALATGSARSLPPATDLLCAPAGEVLQHPLGGTVFVTYRAVCGGLQSSSFHIARVYRVVEVSWSGVTIANDSVVADVLIGLDAVSPEVRNTPPAAAPAPAP